MTGTAISLPVAPSRPRLLASVARVAELSAATRDAAYALFRAAYEGTERARFERDLDEKQMVILLRDADDGSLRGFSTVLLLDIEGPDGPATVYFSGDTVIDPAYWGQKQLQLAAAKLLFTLKLQRPRRPLYWFLISKGYRTYLILANAFPVSCPRLDRDDAGLRELLHRVATERYGRQYDPVTGVIRYDAAHEYVRQGVAPVTPEALGNEHVRFFVERNPGHELGDELACLARVRAVDLVRAAIGFMAVRALRWLRPASRRRFR
jgi:hypothetical protein